MSLVALLDAIAGGSLENFAKTSFIEEIVEANPLPLGAVEIEELRVSTRSTETIVAQEGIAVRSYSKTPRVSRPELTVRTTVAVSLTVKPRAPPSMMWPSASGSRLTVAA